METGGGVLHTERGDSAPLGGAMSLRKISAVLSQGLAVKNTASEVAPRLLSGIFGMCAALLLLLLPASRCFAPPFSSCCHYCVCLRAASASGHAPVATAMGFLCLFVLRKGQQRRKAIGRACRERSTTKIKHTCDAFTKIVQLLATRMPL